MTCSNDPVCSLSMGQGRDSLNLSACYSCCLIPETSCEEFNIFLDRGTIVGTYENREMGFYSRQLYGAVSWKDNSVSSATTDASLKSSVHVNLKITIYRIPFRINMLLLMRGRILEAKQ